MEQLTEPGRCFDCDEPDGRHLRWCPHASRPLLERPPTTGRYSGTNATTSEHEAGAVKEQHDKLGVKPGTKLARVLCGFEPGRRMTAYEAAKRAGGGDHHDGRREATRLLVRGLLVKDGHLENPAPGGRPNVDAFRLTPEGEQTRRALTHGTALRLLRDQ